MQNSKIGWCDHTCNLWSGCTATANGCDNCYAEALSHRWKKNNWGNDNPRLEVKKVWADFKKFQLEAAITETFRTVFVGSMMDIGEKPMPFVNSKGDLAPFTTQALRGRYCDEVIPATPNLIHLMLSKRPGNFVKPTYFPFMGGGSIPRNVMFGTSISDQPTADTLIPHLLNVPGYRFLSVEPLLGSVDLNKYYQERQNHPLDGIDWVIVGGESGPKARKMDLDWFKEIIDVCRRYKIPVFAKQLGTVLTKELKLSDYKGELMEEWPLEDKYKVREFPA